MSRIYRIRWANVAENDLKEIIRHIAAENPVNAAAILEKSKKHASTLHTDPQRGRIVPELQNQEISTYREWIVSPWRIIYRVAGEKVFVLSVIDGRRNVEDILLRRLIGA